MIQDVPKLYPKLQIIAIGDSDEKQKVFFPVFYLPHSLGRAKYSRKDAPEQVLVEIATRNKGFVLVGVFESQIVY